MKDKKPEPKPKEWETTTKECEPKIKTNPNVRKNREMQLCQTISKLVVWKYILDRKMWND